MTSEIVLAWFGLVWFGLVWFWRKDEADRGAWKGKRERGRMVAGGPRNVELGMGMGMGIILMDTRYKVGKNVEKRKRQKFAQILQEEYCMVKQREVGG